MPKTGFIPLGGGGGASEITYTPKEIVGHPAIAGDTVLRWSNFSPDPLGRPAIAGDTVLRWSNFLEQTGALALGTDQSFVGSTLTLGGANGVGHPAIAGDTVLRWSNFSPDPLGRPAIAGDTVLRWSNFSPPTLGSLALSGKPRLLHMMVYGDTNANGGGVSFVNPNNVNGRSDNTFAGNPSTGNAACKLESRGNAFTTITGWTWLPTMSQGLVSYNGGVDATGTNRVVREKIGAAGTLRVIHNLPAVATTFGATDFAPQRSLTDTATVRTDVDALAGTLAGLNDLVNGGFTQFTVTNGAVGVADSVEADAHAWSLWFYESGGAAPTVTRETLFVPARWTTDFLGDVNNRFENTDTSGAAQGTYKLLSAGSFVWLVRINSTRPATGDDIATQLRWWMPDNTLVGSNPRYYLEVTVGSTSATDRIKFRKVASNGVDTIIATATPSGGWRSGQPVAAQGDWLAVYFQANAGKNPTLTVFRFLNPTTRERLFNAVAGDSTVVTQESGYFGLFFNGGVGYAGAPWADDLLFLSGV